MSDGADGDDALPELPSDLRGLNVRDFLEEAVAAVPDRAFLRTRDAVLTYAELDERVQRTAGGWDALGIGKGDRVAFLAANSADFVVAWLALAKLGAVLVAVNDRFRSAEVRTMLEISRPKLLLADDERRPTAVEAARDVPVATFAELGAAAASGVSPPRPPLRADDVVSFIFTSGTTGRPKAVMQTHGNYVLTGQAYPYWLGLSEGTRFYCCLPLFHVNAQAYSTMGAIANRGTLALVERFSASRFWADIAELRIEVVNYIGAMIAILTKRPPSADERRHELRIAYGAPKFPQDQLEEIERRFGITLISGFGMSEATFGLVEALDHRPPGTVGRPRRHPDPRLVNEARVVDEQGRDVADGQVGELLLRNAMLMKGYFGEPGLTADALRGGWLHTGDYAIRRSDGLYVYVDRKKDIVRRRGENVSSVEVELTLTDHPAVAEAAVVGIASELTDEDILAVVVLAEGETAQPQDLVRWCADRLAEYKVPRYVQIVPALPKTPTHKVEKARLRAEAASGPWYDAASEQCDAAAAVAPAEGRSYRDVRHS
jgi:carnitine-CoA ligase